MNDQIIKDIQRRLRALEQTAVRYRAGEVTGTNPLDVALGGSDVSYEDVQSIGPAGLAEQVAALLWGNDLLVLGGKNGPAARGIRTTTFNIANAIPGTTVMPFDSVDYETHAGMVNLNGQITLPEAGVYVATGWFTYGFPTVTADLMISNTGNERRGELRIAASAGQIMLVTAQWRATAGEVIRVQVGQNSGATQASGAGNAALPWYLAVARVA